MCRQRFCNFEKLRKDSAIWNFFKFAVLDKICFKNVILQEVKNRRLPMIR